MPETSFVLSVLSGPNAGAVTLLPPGSHKVGSSIGNAVLLDGVADEALSITLRQNTLRILGAAPGASFLDGRVIGIGKPVEVQLPAVLRLGDETMVALARSEPIAAPRRSPALMILVAVAALGLGLIGSANFKVEPSKAVAMLANQPADGDAPAAAVPSPVTGCDSPCLTAAQSDLRAALDAVGLQALDLSADEGVLRVSGQLPADKQAVWQDLRRDLESRDQSSLPLLISVTNSVAVVPEQPIAVSSAWMGDRPEIRSTSGEVLRKGDISRDGWRVMEILPGKLVLQRGDTMTEVEF